MGALATDELRSPDDVDVATAAAWDALADAADRPLCASAWMLAMQRHVHGADSMRLVIVRDAGALVGVGPFFAARWPARPRLDEYRIMGAQLAHRIEPLAAPGREREVAAALAAHLGGADPEPSMLSLEWVDAASPWPGLLRDAWPGAPPVLRPHLATLDAPVITLAADVEQWAAGHSRNFRRTLKRKEQATGLRGAVVRRTTDAARLEGDLDGLFATHRARFSAIDQATALDAAAEAGVREAAARLLADDRLRLWVVEYEDRIVGAQLYVRGGRDLCAWNGGVEPGWERESLGIVLMHAAVRDAHELGLRRIDLGGGAYRYKSSFGDSDAPLATSSIVPRTRRYPLVRLRLARSRVRDRRLERSRRPPSG